MIGMNPPQLSRYVKSSLATQFCAFVREQLRILGVDLAVLVKVPGICGTASGKAEGRINDGQVLGIDEVITIQIACLPAPTGRNWASPFPWVLQYNVVLAAAEEDRLPARFVISQAK